MTFNKHQCWNTERIGEVISKEALNVDLGTFLATHMPMTDITYEDSPSAIPKTSERNFLEELARMNLSDSHVFAIIKGIPGTGKSHLIRWLAIRYEQIHRNDHVLLIERANNSLKKTIQQIIEKGVFDNAALNEQLKQLKGVTDALSSDGLADTLLGHLQVATRELDWDQRLHHRIAEEKISAFLLDQTVREHLKRQNGPIERIVRFLQDGPGVRNDETPGFEPDDLVLSPQQRGKINQEGYRNVQDVADTISRDRSKQRDQLTDYLNFLLNNYAISRTINLAASDLREIFNNLRQHLRQEGKSLALFIEDITSFTGIDSGLIDVLITSHKSQNDGSLCRLTSVVGITDSYYHDTLRDNVRERITHQLTLNSHSAKSESDMLRDENTLAQFVARYLNAIRLEKKQLQEWEKTNSPSDQLPNACLPCKYSETCHKAFGAFNIASEDMPPSFVGLYPFNKTALVRMYNNLQANVSRTPRALLNDILSYIMQSHGEMIRRGQFPPPSNQLAPRIESQQFDPSSHLRTVEEEGDGDAEYLKTLFLFWGNRNVYRQRDFIGGLSPEIFEAFDLKRIVGRQSSDLTVDTPSGQIIEERKEEPLPNNQKQDTEITEVTNGANVQVPIEDDTSQAKKQSRYIEDISRWYDDGYFGSEAKNELLKWMAELFRTGIDWESYGISMNDYIIPSQASTYFAIEGQSAQITKKHFVFERSSELRFALEAIANLNETDVKLEPSTYGEYLTAIDVWLRKVEPEVVYYIRTKSTQQDIPNPVLDRLIIQNVILLSCLIGELKYSPGEDTLYVLYEQIIASTQASQDALNRKFANIQTNEGFPPSWRELVKDLMRNQLGVTVMETLPLHFNATQGDSKNVRFLHANPILQAISDFEQSDWKLDDIPESMPEDLGYREWDATIKVHKLLSRKFEFVIEDTYKEFLATFNRLKDFFGEDDINEVLAQMYNLLRDMSNLYHIDSKYVNTLRTLDAKKLIRLSKKASQILRLERLNETARYLSRGHLEIYMPLREYCDYFEAFIQEMNKVQVDLREKELSSEAKQSERLTQQALDSYSHITKQLNGLISSGDKTDAS